MKYVIIPRADVWHIASPASRWFDRIIKFRKGELFAVIPSMFYGRMESKHRTAEAVVGKCRALEKQGYKMYSILHVGGAELIVGKDGRLEYRR